MRDQEKLAELQAKLREEHSFDVRFANVSLIKGSGNRGEMGDRLLNDGIKYGAVLRELAPAMPFFEASRLAFDLALQAPRKSGPTATNYDKLFNHFRVNFGFVAATALAARQEQPADTSKFEAAYSALAMSFDTTVLDDARRRPGGFETSDFSIYLLTFLALAAVGRFWSIHCAVEERVLTLPIAKAFEPLRRPLAALVSGAADGPGSLDDFRRAYRTLVNPGAFQLGLVASARFIEVYTWSLVKEKGRITSAVLNLFDS